jgi:hypothetical protein
MRPRASASVCGRLRRELRAVSWKRSVAPAYGAKRPGLFQKFRRPAYAGNTTPLLPAPCSLGARSLLGSQGGAAAACLARCSRSRGKAAAGRLCRGAYKAHLNACIARAQERFSAQSFEVCSFIRAIGPNRLEGGSGALTMGRCCSYPRSVTRFNARGTVLSTAD